MAQSSQRKEPPQIPGRFTLLAPDIVQAIEQGDHPEDLNVTKLITAVPFPVDWDKQRKLLGIG